MSWMQDEPQSPVITPAPKKIPRVFNVWGTTVYGAFSLLTLACMIAAPWWTPPWWILLPMFGYIFIGTSVITFGRIESNKDAKFFIEALKRQSDINKRSMN